MKKLQAKMQGTVKQDTARPAVARVALRVDARLSVFCSAEHAAATAHSISPCNSSHTVTTTAHTNTPADGIVVQTLWVVRRVLLERKLPELAANLVATLPNLHCDQLPRHVMIGVEVAVRSA